MKPYLTAQKFRHMGFGTETDELTDVALTALCQRATSMVDAFCLVPRLPQPHDFRGGLAEGEQHTWRYPWGPTDIGQRKAWPFHWPVKEVTKFQIKVTNTQYVAIDSSELFINNTQRYVEVVSLAITSHGLFQALVVPNIGLATPVLVMDYEYGFEYPEEDERLSSTDGKTWRASHQWWKPTSETTPIVVRKNGVAMTVTTDYTLDLDEGTVLLVEDAADTDVISVDYTHTLPGEIRDAMGHVVAHLHDEAELHKRGMGALRRLTVEEVTLEREKARDKAQAGYDLEVYVPEAAMLLSTYRFDGAVIR